MSRVLDAIRQVAAESPERIAVESGYPAVCLSYATLSDDIELLADAVRDADVSALAVVGDNGAGWIISDLGSLSAGIPVIPVPHFFSPSQTFHLFRAAGIDGVLSEKAEPVHRLCEAMGLGSVEPKTIELGSLTLHLFKLPVLKAHLPAGCAKVTFTSGSTGDPKGVVLTQSAMEQVAASLASVTGAESQDRHLSLLPYATLLENIGGLYAPFLVGATVCAPGLAAVGLSGASGLDVQRFVGMLVASGATTCIMIPQMLHALVAAVEAGAPKSASLRYIAVGGAPVSPNLLERAERLGMPVYEGYGLSEAASVVAVNSKAANRPGSVGKLLPHVELSFAEDGEILVGGSLFEGYLGEPRVAGKMWATGDIGHLDDDGFLYLSGRKKHIFITAYGRNVSPEWVERELSIESAIAQCCVFGEARPFNVAVLVPRAGVTEEQIKAAVSAANARLPDYAQISRWLVADSPFSIAEGLWTGTGRPRRQQIYVRYQEALNALFEES
ncbi:Long-chain acyl-CoA synthetase (AMP-forming) [Mariprofundus ferrinatatus]|uniref:Long-chain acyl-CoA synthetase (AMP-forming) n=1 Tax=Mariprofundus ferrinatatus TaxID=1921087 RepID=A0A2K8LD95_9PROT|nr:AMP-binding protein [Mariprofundus ferrinatatus]ATX82256.1 Long-chain acyl-CoA synthetase (AMP-forming) [Mariprofundus ferrinatatus]